MVSIWFSTDDEAKFPHLVTCEWNQGHSQISVLGFELQEFVYGVGSYFLPTVRSSNQMQNVFSEFFCVGLHSY